MKDRTTPLAAAIIAALHPAVTQAQKADGTRLEPVVVTATRRNENLQDVAQSVTNVSGADIEKQAFQNLQDVIGALPSVNMVSSTPGRNSVIMRGVSTGSAEYRTDSQVAIYLDDQPMTSISQQVDVRLIDIARIETLMGPQGTLFGSSSQSGTIRYITNKPDFGGYSGQVDLEVGTTKGGAESYDLSGWVNIPLSDNFAIRATGYNSLDGGYVDNVLGLTLLGDRDNASLVEEDWNEYKTTGGRIAARWAISPKWESTLSLISQYSDADGAWETDPQLGDNRITRFFDEYRDDDWYQASLNIKGDLGFAELSLTGSYFDRNIAYEWDNMTYDQWRSTNPSFGDLYDTDYEFGTTYNDQKQNRWAYEVRLTSQGDSRFQWLAGAFYEDVYDWWDYGTKIPTLTTTTAWVAAQYYACLANYYGYDVACPLPDTDIYYQNIYDKTVKQKALFGEMTYELTDRWSVTGGARWFEYDRNEFDVYQVPLGLPAYDSGFGTGGLNVRGGKDEDYVFKFATEFHFDDDRMGYFLFSEGFRLGGNNGIRAASTGVIPLEYQPDTMKNYELGMKTQWLEDKLRLNVSLFYMKWDRIQINDSSGDPWWIRGTFNAGTAEQKGVEMNGHWYLTDRFNLEASIFAAEPEFTEDVVYPTDGTIIPKGSELPVSPDRKYWVAMEYTFPDFLPWSGDAWMRWSYSYQSETWDSISAMVANDRDLLLPSWSTSTLQFGFNSENDWTASLVIRNLFDEEGFNYMSSSDYGFDFGDPRWRYVRSLQRPRSVYLSFSKKW